MALYELTQEGVKNTITNQNIPDDNRNRDWRMYQDWLGLGNSADPQTPVISPTIDQEYEQQSEWLKALVQESGINLVSLKARVTTNRP
tara:strand:- start:36838 stop:37101 length:264 start_codon:yes stop_codon:yes gene_type:complete